MDTESINSLLKYFPYTEAEKNLVRELLIKRDPTLMAALSDFLQTKDVTSLNQKFKGILASQQVYRPYDQSPKYDYKQTSNVSTGQVIYTSPNVSTKTYETTNLYTAPSVPSKTYETSVYGAGVSNVGQPTSFVTTSPSKAVRYQEDVKIDDGKPKKELTESVKRSKVDTMENIQRLKRMSEYAMNKEIEESSKPPKENVLKSFTFDFLPEKIKNNYLETQHKKKLIEMASSLSFENFLDIRHFLRLDKIDLRTFVEKAKARVEELHPLKTGQDLASYNPGFSLEEFIALLCGESEIPKSKMGYIGLLFFYLDYNHNQILETDEILQGFIMLGPGDKKDKITAAFLALGGDSLCLSETELSHYMEIVIRVYKLREDMGSDEKIDLYDIQKDIDLAAKSLAKRIFETVDYDESGSISLEEFLIWHDRIEAKAKLSDLKNDVSFKKSLALAKESKKKRVEALFYSRDVQTQVSTKEKLKNDILDNSLHTKTLENLKKTLKVDKIDVGTAIKVFTSMNYSKALTTKEFAVFWEKVFAEEKVKFTAEEEANVNKEIVRLFQILDTNKNGVLEWDELMSALIFVLRGSESEKARIAFQQFDSNGDGILQFKELFFFLKGIFNLLMYDNQHDLFKKETPDMIAFATAKECFSQFKLDVVKDSIDYKTFQKWYSSNM